MSTWINNAMYKLVVIIVIGFVPFSLIGQQLKKKYLSKADYRLWHTMRSEQLSNHGTWVSYGFGYPNNVDSMFVIHTKSLKKYGFPNVNQGLFSGENYFCFLRREGLVLFDLHQFNETFYKDVSRYDFSKNGDYLVTLDKQNTLSVRFKGTLTEQIVNVSSFEFDSAKNRLIYATSLDGKGSVGTMDFKNSFSKQILVPLITQTFDVFKWKINGDSVAFFGVAEGIEEVYFYDFSDSKLYNLKNSNASFPTQLKVSADQNIELKISRDGTKVFFGITTLIAKDTTMYSSGPEIWNSKDRKLYPERKLVSTVAHPQFLAAWLPKQAIVNQLSNEQENWFVLNGNQDFAIVGDKFKYEPQYHMFASMDYFLVNVSTGEKELIFKKVSGFDSEMDFSPDGRFITYYKDANWWLYDIGKKASINLTKGLNVFWDTSHLEPASIISVWRQTDWSKDNHYVICYDTFDIWAISTDGVERRRLTNGNDKKIRFRFDALQCDNVHEFNYSDSGTNIFDLSKSLILNASNSNDGMSGFYKWLPNKKIIPLVYEAAMITKYRKSEYSDSFIYVRQRYDCPPSIIYVCNGSKKEIMRSNVQQENYFWGRSELIHYTDSKGNLLNGALYYPANYDSAVQVPLVVYIYETVADNVHQYINPSNENMLGFNISNLTTSGYAVLLADISYELGSPGVSASECVQSAVAKVVAMRVADSRKIGLYGHSFGGYETNFIITHTNIFSAAISGAGISDVVWHYFSYNADWGSLNSWRYESQQWRMGNPFYNNKEGYYANSPLQNADKVTTPLLTWTAKLDRNIVPEQSQLYYSAFRRLNKDQVMVVYPDDEHVLFKHKNQIDLTSKVEDWFGYYLKGEAKQDWMKADFERF